MVGGNGNEGYRNGYPRGVGGMIYPLSGNEVLIPHNKITNPNTNT